MRSILKIPYIIYFVIFYAWEVILSNIEVAYEVLTPTHHMTPGIVAIPLDIQNPFGINLLANLITMTPGTMSVEVSPNQKILYVYGLHVKDVEQFRVKMKTRLESHVKRLFD